MRLKWIMFLTFVFALPLRADTNWVQNGDFADGSDHWRGNGRSPAEYAIDNNQSPLDKPDPFVSKGLILPLRGADWDKVQQDFKGQGTIGVLTITYMLSPSLTFSTDSTNYTNIPDALHIDGWQPFGVTPGNWVVFITDFGTNSGTYFYIKPKLGIAEPQTIRIAVRNLTPFSDKTITIGFPPGSGTLVLLGVSIVSPGGAKPAGP